MATTRLIGNKAVIQNPAQKSVSNTAAQNAINKGFLGNLFNPGIIFNPGGIIFNPGGATTGGSGTTPPPSTGATTTPSAPSGPGANLLALLAAIPIASDGQVISADYHNSLRSALIALANQMGMGRTTPTTSYSFAPAFLPIGATNWSVSANPNLIASAAGANPDGWLPVHLPDGQTIQGMTVTGKLTTPAPTTFSVTLYREDVTAGGSGPTSLIAVPLQTQNGVFSQSGQISTGSAASSPAALLLQQATLQDLQLIDNSQYKYFLRATVTGAGGATVAEIDAVQILIGS